jgi:hypothetical protein
MYSHDAALLNVPHGHPKGKQKRKGNVAFVHAMKAYGLLEVQVHSLLTSALDGSDLLVPRPGPRYPPRKLNVLRLK